MTIDDELRELVAARQFLSDPDSRDISNLAAELLLERESKRAAEAECERLRQACAKTDDEVQQILGKALGYAWFKDDQKNFPGATEADGVCVGDHVGASLAMEIVDKLAASRDRVRALEEQLVSAYEAFGEIIGNANTNRPPGLTDSQCAELAYQIAMKQRDRIDAALAGTPAPGEGAQR